MIPEEDLDYEEVPDEDGPARSDYTDEGFRSRAQLVSRAAAAGMTPMEYMASGKAAAVTRYEENERRAKTHGLPAGLAYDPETKVISGTPLEVSSGPLKLPESVTSERIVYSLDDEVVEGEIVTEDLVTTTTFSSSAVLTPDGEVIPGEVEITERLTPKPDTKHTRIQGWLDQHGGEFFMEGFNEYFGAGHQKTGPEILRERAKIVKGHIERGEIHESPRKELPKVEVIDDAEVVEGEVVE